MELSEERKSSSVGLAQQNIEPKNQNSLPLEDEDFRKDSYDTGNFSEKHFFELSNEKKINQPFMFNTDEKPDFKRQLFNLNSFEFKNCEIEL